MHISNIKKISRKKFLHIDYTSLQSLEVLRTIRTEGTKGTLLDCLDSTLTPMGGRMFRNWLCRPLCELSAIELRQDAVAELKDSDNQLVEVRKLLGDIADPSESPHASLPRGHCRETSSL